MIKKAIWIASALSLLGVVSASSARADEWNKKTVLTFTQPFEIPGKVLPAGTYTLPSERTAQGVLMRFPFGLADLSAIAGHAFSRGQLVDADQ